MLAAVLPDCRELRRQGPHADEPKPVPLTENALAARGIDHDVKVYPSPASLPVDALGLPAAGP